MVLTPYSGWNFNKKIKDSFEQKYMDNFKRTQEIRTILLNDWDPLGVGENSNLSDEYDNYIPGILLLLDAHCTEDAVYRGATKKNVRDADSPFTLIGPRSSKKKLGPVSE